MLNYISYKGFTTVGVEVRHVGDCILKARKGWLFRK